MPKNVQTTAQLHSFHMLPRLYSKSFKLGFSSTSIKNFQIYKLLYKLGLEKAEKPEIKSSTFVAHRESKEIPEKHLLLLH